jgi:hypothetical protein
VADLRPVAGSDSSVTLSWTATGDDGRLGRPAFYRLRWSDAPLDSAAFETAPSGIDVPARAAAGQLEQVVVRGLDRGRRYWIAMRAVDAAGNVSALSNEVAPVIGRLAAQSGIALLPSRVPSRSPVQIEWQGVAEFRDGPQFIQIFDIHGRRLSTLPLTGATGGITQWDGRDGVGTWVGPGVYFARLTSGPFHSQARIVLLR